MMTLNDYREQFRRNLMVMSRTAVGTLDLSASATKADSMAAGSADDAQNLALVNTDRAIDFLFENRVRSIKSQKDMEDLIPLDAEFPVLRGRGGRRIQRICHQYCRAFLL